MFVFKISANTPSSLSALEDKVMLKCSVPHTLLAMRLSVWSVKTVNFQQYTFCSIKYIKLLNQALVLAQAFVSPELLVKTPGFKCCVSRHEYTGTTK